jgi:hypothetical protein
MPRTKQTAKGFFGAFLPDRGKGKKGVEDGKKGVEEVLFQGSSFSGRRRGTLMEHVRPELKGIKDTTRRKKVPCIQYVTF